MKELLKKIQDKGIILNTQEELPYSLLSIVQEEITRKEVAHSKIIASLLSPNQSHDYKFSVVNCFFDEIGVNEKDKYKFVPTNAINFKVEKEKCINVEKDGQNSSRFIDILITWNEGTDNYAVIIENKLNNAVSQKNQLNDYYDCISKSYTVKKVVFMPISPYRSAKHTDTSHKVLECTVDFNIFKIIKWLNSSIKELENSPNSYHLINYRDLLTNMVYKYRNIMKAEELLSQLSNNEIDKIIELSSIVSSDEWHNAKYSIIEKKLVTKFTKMLQVNKYGKFANLFFEPYEYWIELWSDKNSIDLYICSYKDESLVIIADYEFKFSSNSSGKNYFKCNDISTFCYPQKRDELTRVLESILKVLSKYNN